MGEISLEASTVSRFIISLSKSIQALCHGCMDFDDSIEMIGYININIDSGKTVDCVLNEKVRKSAANSMTCISNSFQAKKEKPKQTKDSSCSPIQPSEYSSHYSPNKRQYSEHFQRGPVRKKHRYHSKPALPYSEQYSTSGNAYNEQSDTTSSEFTNPQQTVKTEVPGGDSSFFDISSSTSSQNFLVKQEQMDLPVSQTDAEDQGVSDKNEDSIETGGEESFKFNVDKDPPSNVAEQSHERTENAPPKFEHDQENQKQFGNAEVGAESSFLGSEDVQDMHISQDQQPHGSREETSEDAQFEVIEIGDDDEDMHGIFDQTEENTSCGVAGKKSMKRLGAPTSSPSLNSRKSHQPSFVCAHCRETYFTRYHYQIHMQQYHPSSLPFICDLCPKGFFTYSGLYLHKVSHSGRPFSCDICDQRFVQKIHLIRHLMSVHKCIRCKTCLGVFKVADFQGHVDHCH